MFKHQLTDFGVTDLPRKTVNGQRFYQVGDQLLPSVTTVMGILSEEGIAKWREEVGEEEANRISSKAAAQGNVVHELAEQYVMNQEPDTYRKSPIHLEMFNALKPVLDSRVGRIYGVEKRLYSTALGVAGTADLLADFDGVPSVVDYKTSSKDKKREWIAGYFQQTSCYSFMAFERAGLHLPQIVVLVVNSATAEVQVFKERARDWIEPSIETIKRFNEKIADG